MRKEKVVSTPERELAVLKAVLVALQGINSDARERIIEYIRDYFYDDDERVY